MFAKTSVFCNRLYDTRSPVQKSWPRTLSSVRCSSRWWRALKRAIWPWKRPTLCSGIPQTFSCYRYSLSTARYSSRWWRALKRAMWPWKRPTLCSGIPQAFSCYSLSSARYSSRWWRALKRVMWPCKRPTLCSGTHAIFSSVFIALSPTVFYILYIFL